MRTSHWVVAFGCAGLALVATKSASAQERVERPSYFEQPVRAPVSAFELGVGAAYSQGTTSPLSGMGATDLSKAGGSFSLQLGYRFDPHWALSVFGQYDEFMPGDRLGTNAGARGGVAGINGTYHFTPHQRLDPWIRLGAGYRMLWTTEANEMPDTLWHGFQLAKLDVGADLRTSEDVAIGPTIGVDLSEFVWQIH